MSVKKIGEREKIGKSEEIESMKKSGASRNREGHGFSRATSEARSGGFSR
jgi:hypothetical protein